PAGSRMSAQNGGLSDGTPSDENRRHGHGVWSISTTRGNSDQPGSGSSRSSWIGGSVRMAYRMWASSGPYRKVNRAGPARGGHGAMSTGQTPEAWSAHPTPRPPPAALR